MLISKIRMRFYLVADHDTVRLKRKLVAEQRNPIGQRSVLHHVHRGSDGRSDSCLGNSVGGQNLLLPLGGGASVASHGRHDKGLGPPFLQDIADGSEDYHNIGNSPAARSDSDALAFKTLRRSRVRLHLFPDMKGYVGNLIGVEMLPYGNHFGDRDFPVLDHKVVNFRKIDKHVVSLGSPRILN